MPIRIKLFADHCQPSISKKGDWVDLRAKKTIHYISGDTVEVKLGVAMELPEGYEAHLLPRSSTFKNYGLTMSNGMGIIDNTYCGDLDEWKAVFIASREGTINKGDRICQFRIQKNMPEFRFEFVDKLNNPDRGGFGSTGIN